MYKRFVLRIIITLIRKHFPESLSFDNGILVWKWTQDIEDEVFGRKAKNDI